MIELPVMLAALPLSAYLQVATAELSSLVTKYYFVQKKMAFRFSLNTATLVPSILPRT
jgi:hypothetical protein